MRLTTATILFTDIEGSTRLWEERSADMAPAVAEHDRILRRALTSCHVSTVKGLGDGVMAVFESAGDAIEAAIRIQRDLLAVDLGSIESLHVRVGVHTGEVEWRDGDVFGPAVNRSARLMSAANGGQIVVSATTASMVSMSLPPGAGLVDLGTHRLKDLSSPETIYQLVVPGLPDAFPALRTLSDSATNLPIQINDFVGRKNELEDLLRLAERSRMVTLTGPGGVGKTRLMLQAAAELGQTRDDGCWWVDLAPSTSADVLREIASALGVTEQGDRPLIGQLADHLASRRLVLVLDNFEHVLDCAADLAHLLQAAPGLTALTTSRVPLEIRGEVAYRLDPLDPDGEALDLFIDRATAANPRIEWTAEALDAARAICRRVDGLPLGVELSAARCRVLTPAAISAQLSEHFDLLAGREVDRQEHHRTIAATVAWSYDLLHESSQRGFERLAVFAGSFELEAASRVCGLEPFEALELLIDLADRSLLQSVPEDPPRWRMLQTVRAYARARLDESRHRPAAEDAHTGWFFDLAVESDEALRGKAQEWWHQRLSLDMDDFRMVLRRLATRGEHARAVEMSGWLGRLWYQQGHGVEALGWYDQLLGHPPEGASEGRALALAWRAMMLYNLGRGHQRTATLLDEAEHAAVAAGSGITLAYIHNMRGFLATDRGDMGEAVRGFRTAVEHLDRIGSTWATAPLFNLGLMMLDAGDTAEAQQIASDLLRRATEADDRWGVVSAVLLEAEAALEDGDIDKAQRLATRALEGAIAIKTQVDIHNAQLLMSGIAADRGDLAEADRWAAVAERTANDAGISAGPAVQMVRAAARVASGLFEEGLALLAEDPGAGPRSPSLTAMAVLSAAEAFAGLSRPEEAAALVAAFDAHIEASGFRTSPRRAAQRRRILDQLPSEVTQHPAPTLEAALKIVESTARRLGE